MVYSLVCFSMKEITVNQLIIVKVIIHVQYASI